MRVRHTEENSMEIKYLLQGTFAADLIDRVIADPIREGICISGNLNENAKETYKRLNNNIDNFIRPDAPIGRIKDIMKQFNYSMDQCTLFALTDTIVHSSQDENAQEVPVLPVLMAQREGKVFHKADLDAEPYLKEVKLQSWEEGSCKVKFDILRKNEPFLLGPPIIVDGIAAPRLGISDHKRIFAQIETSDGQILGEGTHPSALYLSRMMANNISGRILTLGCDLGVFVHMASEKKDVDSLVVVEPNPDVAKIFTSHILPQFKQKDKVTIVVANPYEYASNLVDGDFDFICANSAIDFDPTKSSEDALMRLKSILCPKLRHTTLLSWTEANLIVLAHAVISNLICLEFSRIPFSINTVLGDDEDAKYHFAKLYEVCRDILAPVDFRTPEVIREYLHPDKIRELLDTYFASFPIPQQGN